MGNRRNNPGSGPASGEAHGRAKLTKAQVLFAREKATRTPIKSKRSGWVYKTAIEWGVDSSTLWRAITGETWAGVPGAFDRKAAHGTKMDWEPETPDAKADKTARRTSPLATQSLQDLRSACFAPIPEVLTSRARQAKERGRSRSVAAYVRRRANGVCEACDSPAPFKTAKGGEPYLEVHHLLRKSEVTLDSPWGVAAICPTCHRMIHHGELGRDYNRRLFGRIQEREVILGTRFTLSRLLSEMKGLADLGLPRPENAIRLTENSAFGAIARTIRARMDATGRASQQTRSTL